MRAMIIKDGVVIDIAESSLEFAKEQGWVISNSARIGDHYNPETNQFTPPPRWASLEDAQSAKLAKLDQARDEAFASGLSYQIDSQADVIQTRPQDQINLLGLSAKAQLLIADGVTEAVMPFRGLSNTTHMLTPHAMSELALAALAHIESIYQQSWQLKDAVNAAESIEAVEAISWPGV